MCVNCTHTHINVATMSFFNAFLYDLIINCLGWWFASCFSCFALSLTHAHSMLQTRLLELSFSINTNAVTVHIRLSSAILRKMKTTMKIKQQQRQRHNNKIDREKREGKKNHTHGFSCLPPCTKSDQCGFCAVNKILSMLEFA